MSPSPEPLRALSVRQPWAELILRGHKRVEYRSQATHIRGRVYLYASLAKPDPADAQVIASLDDLPRGLVVGTVEIVGCELGNDGYEWHLAHPQRLDTPLTPVEQPQAVWFYPFGPPLEAPDNTSDEETPGEPAFDGEPTGALAETALSDQPTQTRFAPVLAACDTPPFTPYHAKYLAYDLTRRVGADHADKLARSLCNATVDLNPHQIDAALFAFRSPLSRGAILADEVGLGKTIEAGLVISQLWAENRRRILVVTPASLRKQWSRELAEKFFLPSVLLEAKSFRELSRRHPAPFMASQQVVICSYEFARRRSAEVAAVPWDLVIIDEAHRLRNVYKKDNKIARTLRDALRDRPKILLTATPLQNSLMELFGLATFVDEHVFGSEESFRERYAKKSEELSPVLLADLRARLAPICQRTLRKQVVEYVRYTRRIPITEDFTPSREEQRLYEQVSAYLQRQTLHALPSSQRQLIELVLRKILASSSFAIAATLGTMIGRLNKLEQTTVAGPAARGTTQTAPDEAANAETVADVLGDDFEQAETIEEEWPGEDATLAEAPSPDGPAEGTETAERPPTPAEILQSIRAEALELSQYKALAESITENAKGTSLLKALRLGFAKAGELGAPAKALIFTESRRTQTYLRQLLEQQGYAGQIVLFNGTNTDPESKRIYREWLQRHAGQDTLSGSPSADMRAALVEEFATTASIMIATESAAEGVNLQFCSLVVNYDLPWNPQRIEQRIGRCHRYGQQHDVVVINFVNRANEADLRVFELLNQKFQLFDGVFGASDDVLGALESGIDIEKRISEIYQRCRTADQIRDAFDQLQRELDEQISSTMAEARVKLLENFDADVHQKLRLCHTATRQQLDRYEDRLWALTATELADRATFDLPQHSFTLQSLPPGLPTLASASGASAGGASAGGTEPEATTTGATTGTVPLGTYRLHPPHPPGPAGAPADVVAEGWHLYRPAHPLAEALIAQARDRALPCRELRLDYGRRGARVSVVERLQGQSGWLRVEQFTVSALDVEDSLLFAGVTDDGQVLDAETCEKLLTIPATAGGEVDLGPDVGPVLDRVTAAQRGRVVAGAQRRNERFFDAESDKLDRWADDLKDNLERELRALDGEIREAKKAKRQAADLQAKIAAQKRENELEQKRHQKKRTLFEAQDEIEQRKERLVAEVEARLSQHESHSELFTIRWHVV